MLSLGNSCSHSLNRGASPSISGGEPENQIEQLFRAVCRLAKISLDAEGASPAVARRFVVSQLERWELSQLSEVAALLTSELVTNAIVHTNQDSPVALAVAVTDGSLEVTVSDHEPVPEAGLHANVGALNGTRATAERGRGLAIVEKLADEWGTTAIRGGKLVWFRLGTAHWSYLSACRCGDPELERVRLESGRFVAKLTGPWDIA